MENESSTQAVPPPPPPPAPTNYLRPVRPKLSVKATRLTASTFLLIASLLLFVSMAVSWWGASTIGGGNSTVENLLPGWSFTITSKTGLVTEQYAGNNLVHVGQLYEAVLGIGLFAALTGFLGMLLSYLGAFGRLQSRAFQKITLLLTFITFGGAVLLPVLVAVGQPGAFNADLAAGGGSCGPSPNPCSSFWASSSAGGVAVSWGADVGWYLSVVAAVFLAVALLQLFTTRRMPFTRAEISVASSPVAPTAASGAGPSSPPLPPTVPVAPSPPETPQQTASYCPKCGNPMTYVAQYSRWYCLTERVYL